MRHSMLCSLCVLLCTVFACNISDPEDDATSTAVLWSVSPAAVTFNAVKVGQEDTQTLLITNTGRADLLLEDLDLIESDADLDAEISFANKPDSLPVSIAPGKSVSLNIVWAPLNTSDDSGALTLRSNASKSPTQTIPLTVPEPLKESGDVSLEISPSRASFDQVPLGETRTVDVSISLGAMAQILTIEQVFLIESDEDELPEFSFASSEDTPFELNSSNMLTLTISYTARNAIKDTGLLRLKTSNAQTPNIDIPIDVNSLDVPGILAPEEVHVKNAPEGEVAEVTFAIRNNTDAAWPIRDITLTEDEPTFTIRYFNENSGQFVSQMPEAIGAGEQLRVQVSLDKGREGIYLGTLMVLSDEMPQMLPIKLRANVTTTCLRFSGAQPVAFQDFDLFFDFGVVPRGEASSGSIFVTNCNPSKSATIQGVSIDGPQSSAFSTREITANNTLTLNPLERATLPVRFTPSIAASQIGVLSISTTDGNYASPLVRLQGQGGVASCANVAAKMTDLNTQQSGQTLSVVPLSTLELAVTSMHEAGTRFDWVMRQAPDHALTRIVPVAQRDAVTLFVPLVGEYIVDVYAISPDGQRTCSPASLTISAQPKSAIYVQLHWHTPNDASPLDANGADLDVHYSRDDTRWNESMFDIYWQNPTADWGDPGPADDPILVREDDGGYGPEAISHGLPETVFTEDYHVAAYYFANNGLGVSYASMQLYVDQTLIFDAWSPALQRNQFWNVGVIKGATRSFTRIDSVRSGFPNAP